MKNEKTFKEVIATIKEGETYVSVQNYFQMKEIICSNTNILFKIENPVPDENIICTGVSLKQTFVLKRKLVDFTEAFAAYELGKEIESDYSQRRYEKGNAIDIGFAYNKNNNTWYQSNSFNINEIREGWYINE